MKLSQFDYTLPEERIARYPAPNRRDSRLLVLDGPSGNIQDSHFKDLLALLRPNDCLVFNDTRVIPARLYGFKATGGRVEILIERLRGAQEALCHVKGSKALKEGAVISFKDANATVLGREGNCLNLAFDTPILPLLDRIGEVPLPPYFERDPEALDMSRYQTVYAVNPGAVAAPTAGLHFDEPMLAALDAMGVIRAQVTLHVGAGTFQPVKTEDITAHEMHSEWAQVSKAACEAIKRAKSLGGRVIAVGTTSLRSLESASNAEGIFPFEGETNLFIYPGYRFNMIDALITNFHLPKSTLLMLVSALAGYDHIRAAYQHAIDKQYMFFSYGDAVFMTAEHPPKCSS